MNRTFLLVIMLSVSLAFAQNSPGQHCNNYGCQWNGIDLYVAMRSNLEFGCNCVFTGDPGCTQGECDNGVCVLNGDSLVQQGAWQTQHGEWLEKHPWLADRSLASSVALTSRIPSLEKILRDEQQFELTHGVPTGTVAKINVQVGKTHVMVRVTATREEQTLEFWTEQDSHTVMGEWVRTHPEPEEKLTISQSRWTLSSGQTVRGAGAVRKYAEPTSCGPSKEPRGGGE